MLTEETESNEPEEIVLTPTLEYFENAGEKSSIDDIVNEIGLYTKQGKDDLNYYIWKLEDGTNAKVYVTDTDEKICRIQIVKGDSEYTIYSLWSVIPSSFHSFDELWEGEYVNETMSVNGYDTNLLDRTEYGPDLDRGWYIREEEDGTYIVICAGKTNPYDNTMFVSYFKYWESGIKPGFDRMTLKVDFQESDAAEFKEGYKYPCCVIKLNKLPKQVEIMTEDETEIPFGGNISDMEEWGIDEEIADNYLAIFTDGGTDCERRTYYYITDDYQYRYINAIVKSDSGESKILVKGTGTFRYKKDIIKIAKQFESCRYVRLRGQEDTPADVNEYIKSDEKLQQ